MMTLITSLLAGLVFGIGLILSGMTNPAKIIGFLDFTGKWDPSLLFVMLGAILVSFFAFRVAAKRASTVLGQPISIPTKKDLDVRLIAGSAIFGIGWGLAGYCPGPGLASIITGGLQPILFVIAMLIGMALYEAMQNLTMGSKK
jgi:uncharacterized membrane protein YedE/YeeE